METYTNCWTVGSNVPVYSTVSSSTIVGYVSGLVDADDGGSANLSRIRITSPISGYANRSSIDTSYGDVPSYAWYGGSGTSNQLQQSSTKKIAVFNLQFTLKRLGYNPGPVDGIFGSQTRNAVIAFQNARGLTADGIVGDLTKQELIDALGELG